MPPALHPRSRQTLSLFTTTLILSFLVVGTPHILPCPADHRTYADSSDPDAENRRPRRRRKPTPISEGDAGGNGANEAAKSPLVEETHGGRRRECPVPKPGGLLGQVLGFREENARSSVMAREIRIEQMKRKREVKTEKSSGES